MRCVTSSAEEGADEDTGVDVERAVPPVVGEEDRLKAERSWAMSVYVRAHTSDGLCYAKTCTSLDFTT